LEDSPEFKRAKFWFWPIVIIITIFFGFFAGIQGAFIGFFYELVGGGFFSMKVCRIKKSENNGNARLSIRIHYREDTNKNVFNSQ